jgi:hypothetical protein
LLEPFVKQSQIPNSFLILSPKKFTGKLDSRFCEAEPNCFFDYVTKINRTLASRRFCEAEPNCFF